MKGHGLQAGIPHIGGLLTHTRQGDDLRYVVLRLLDLYSKRGDSLKGFRKWIFDWEPEIGQCLDLMRRTSSSCGPTSFTTED